MDDTRDDLRKALATKSGTRVVPPSPLKTVTQDAVKSAVNQLLQPSMKPVDFHRRLVEILAERKFDPVEELVRMCQEEWLPLGSTKRTWRLDASLRVKVMTELMQ